ncbi:UPF0481 protein At3g47200-like [Humulus lupulus]|uniref:UPF0481 protein At3g47200-like n=1 Tax=Humulus lupulus TaxID=3486 RepID=UPI002B40E7C1|nr:UPF0481 protein At3g47200-like [Humulus lupulus]
METTPTMDSGEDIAIDIKSMAININRKLSGNLVMSSSFSIFRIPTILSRHTKNAYVPNAFAIGPFHRNSPSLQPTERIKQKYLRDLLSNNPNCPTLDTLLTAIDKIQMEARGYYAGPIEMKTYEFVEMLVLDGCFIIELFRKNEELFRKNEDLSPRDKEDPIFTMSCLLQFLHHDLILLENQIPWIVLNTLFDLTNPTPSNQKSLVQLAIEFFPSLLRTKNPILDFSSTELGKSKHILDLLRNSLITKFDERQKINHDWQHIRSATGLRDSGITFKQNTRAESILDIRFFSKTGIMEIPPLLIQETTETVFRNLISLEQCCPNYKPIITCYAVLLDNLIDTSADIQVLQKNKVIDNWLNVDDATKFFNRLYIDTYVKENYYFSLTSEVNKYCKQRWNIYRRVLTRDYFKHPWALVSVIAASVVLVLTFLQTFYAIKD